MAETTPSASTFDALTQDYTPKVLVDNIFSGTPLWEYFRRNMLGVSGRAWTPIVEIATEDGEWYDAGDEVTNPTTVTGEIATRAAFKLKFFRRKVLLNAQDTDLQGSLGIVDVLKAQVRNATESARRNLSVKALSGNPAANPAQMDSLLQACDSTGLWGTLDPAVYPTWKAHTMAAQAAGGHDFASAVSPSVENLALLVDETTDTTGEAPDLLVVHPKYWHVLYGQFTREEYAALRAANANNNVVRWGFSSLFIRDVPVVRDRDMYGAAFVADQDTRAAAKGYEAVALNFKHLKLAFNQKRSFKWDPDGWRRPTNFDQYLNYFYFWGTIGGDARRTLGHVYNVDLAQRPKDWTPGVVALPG